MKRPKRSLGCFFVLVLFLCLSIAVGLSIWNYIQDDTLEAIYWLAVTVIVKRWAESWAVFQADDSDNGNATV